MSLSEASPVQITFNTAQDISNEILGGAIQFCKETGYKPNTKTLTFFWSAFLFAAKEELEEHQLIQDVMRSYTYSLGKVFRELSDDTQLQEHANELRQQYWNKISAIFLNLHTDTEIVAVLRLVNQENSQKSTSSADQPIENARKSFSRVSSIIRSNIYCILRRIDNSMSIQYKGVLDSIRFTNISQASTANKPRNVENSRSAESTKAKNTDTPPLGMAWYNFLVKFALFAGTVLNAIFGLTYMTGGIYTVETDGLITAEDVYAYYGAGLQLIDILYGCFLLAFAALCMIFREKLVKYEPDAPKFVCIFYSILAGVPFLYSIIVALIMSVSLPIEAFLALIVGLIILFCNIKYFKKREHLFVGDPPPTQENAPAPSKTPNDIPITSSATTTEVSAQQSISFCRKCGAKLLDGSQFCHKCGTKAIIESTIKETPIKTYQISPIEELVLLTVSLPAAIANKLEKEMNIVKNQYTYCDTIIFLEFFIRANALELAPSRECAMKFSDIYIDKVIKETINTVQNAETFFTDLFYSRATLYDNIVMNSTEPIIDIVEVLTHIIHKEIDDNNYVITNDINYRYFGGIFENLAIKEELVNLFQCINDVTKDNMKELKDYMKTLI